MRLFGHRGMFQRHRFFSCRLFGQHGERRMIVIGSFHALCVYLYIVNRRIDDSTRRSVSYWWFGATNKLSPAVKRIDVIVEAPFHQRILFANEVVEAGCFATQLCTSVAWLTNTNQLGIPLLLFAPSAVASASPQFYPFGVPVQLTGYGRLILWYVSATDRRQLDKWIYRKHY